MSKTNSILISLLFNAIIGENSIIVNYIIYVTPMAFKCVFLAPIPLNKMENLSECFEPLIT